MSTYLTAFALFSRNVRLLLFASATNGFAFFGIYSLLMNLYLLRLGYGPEFIGLVNGAGPLALGLGSIPAGIISRRFGTRRALVASYVFVMIGLSLLPCAEFVPVVWQPAWLLGNYVLAWLAATLFVVASPPFLMASTTLQERNHAFAIQSALAPVAGFAGSLIGGVLPGFFAGAFNLTLSDPAVYRYSLWCAALLYLLAIAAVYATQEVSIDISSMSTAAVERFPYAIILLFATVMFLRSGGEWTVRVFFNVYLDAGLQAPIALIGMLLAVSQLMGLAALLAPTAIERWGKVKVTGGGLVLMMCSFLPLLLIGHWFAAGIAFMLLNAGFALMTPAFIVLSQDSVSAHWRTTLSGAMSMALGVGIASVAFSGGYVIAHAGYGPLFGGGAALLGIAMLLFWAYFRKKQGQSPQLPAQEANAVEI